MHCRAGHGRGGAGVRPTINSDSVAQDQLRAFAERIRFSSSQLKKVTAEARPIIERQLADAEMLAGLREVVAAAGGDWGQLKALIKAQIQDEDDEAGDGKRVQKILDRADYATAYADMLGLGNLNEKNNIGDDQTVDLEQEEFDPETSEITEPAAPATTPPGAIAADLSDEGTNSAQPEPLSSDTQSTAARMDVPHEAGDAVGEILNEAAQPLLDTEAGTQARPVDTISEPDKSARPSGDGLAAPAAFKPYDGPRDSQGLARPYGCLELVCCHSSTWPERCHSCAQALAIKAGGTPIPHQGEVA